MIGREIQVRSLLNKSKIFDYCLNPYRGCQVGCRYCYARLFIPRYSGHKEPWGTFVDVKANAVEILKSQIGRAPRGVVWVSSVCDPYQPLEGRYRLTRRLLEVLLQFKFPINLQTKNVLVLRDLDLFCRFEEIEVGLTITTDNESIARLFEPGASPICQRIEALEKLKKAGLKTFAFLGPLLPGNPERLISQLDGKVNQVFIDRMNYLPSIIAFYRRHGLERFAQDDFFLNQKEKLLRALEATSIEVEVLF
ncbi:MAG: radical SAM protein [Candidatus Aminicenantes bacterium]|nr:radical SAM protein [Candidatus Aminicenantes bacterium]